MKTLWSFRWMGMCFLSVVIAGPWAYLLGKDTEQPAKPAAADAKPTADVKPAAEKPAADEKKTSPGEKLVMAVTPKALNEHVKQGLEYLVAQQDNSGGWGQGGGWRQGEKGGRVEGKEVKDPPDVGNTCIAMLALIRAGNTPKEGAYAKQLSKGLDYVLEKIEKSDRPSMYVTDVRDTQLQVKIGQFVDTFTAALVLSELKGKAGDETLEKRLVAGLNKCIGKIEENQKTDGTFAGNTGWASVLSQNLCSKALNRATQNGVAVKGEVLARDFKQTADTLNLKTGEIKGGPALAGTGGTTFTGGTLTLSGGLDSSAGKVAKADAVATASEAKPRAEAKPGDIKAAEATAAATPPAGAVAATDVKAGAATLTLSTASSYSGYAASKPSDAGVSLYNLAGNGGRLNDLSVTAKLMEKQARTVLDSPTSSKDEKEAAEKNLEQAKEITKANDDAVSGLIKKLDDKQFLADFGNNGGEEFLSYMNISEMLVVKGGKEWETWDRNISDNLNRVQNKDGSWSGDHCITGRTFCTGAALLTLMADRTPVPTSAKIKGEKTEK